MEMRPPSQTAVNTAVWRAIYMLLDENPKILADPFARDLAGDATNEALVAAHDAHPLALAPHAVRPPQPPRRGRTGQGRRTGYAAVRHPGCRPGLLCLPPSRPRAQAA